ncbi:MULTISPECIES: hypothetical protein [Enterobacteriaceae]|uniref:hypothetical protein n=1 Tax=Enterobacteriaceae TaxID=543 RepID=UPI000272ABFC|nr:hypothetical protein [Enterobacter sp. Ag1]EJF30464.1 hypothetical protein A936_14629 [Enterobacter sp. Ag1]
MDKEEIRTVLFSRGFTKKESAFIAHWVEKEGVSYIVILRQLRRAFLGGVFLRLLILAFCVVSYINDGVDSFYGIIFVGVFSFFALEIFAPFKVGAKIFLNYNKIINQLDL